MKNKITCFFCFVILFLSGAMFAQKTKKSTNDELMEWFREAKFGMFIHFGASTSEDYLKEGFNKTERYEASVKNFNPVDLDAKEWVRIAKDAGMKYIVFTTKHHDGFCKWDSKLTDWDVIDQTEFKRDIVGELAAACKEADIELGFYYSIADWYHPEYDATYSNRKGFHFKPNLDADITKYMDFMYGQIKELCENYQPRLFWFDGSSGFRNKNKKRLLGQQEMVDLLNSYGAISNSRLGDDDALKYVNYLSMGDNMSPNGNIGVDFESAQTMNHSWHFDSKDHDWKSVDEMLDMLVHIVGNGGNYLLNVGPNKNGVIPKASQIRLKSIGEWTKKNGEAIYGTQASPYLYEFNWGSITQKQEGAKTKLYLNVTKWPKNGDLKLYGLHNSIVNASLLVSGKVLSYETKFNVATGLDVHTIKVPKIAPDPYVSVIVLEIDGKPIVDQGFLQQSDNTLILNAFQSTIHDKEFISNKPLRPIDQKQFTVLKKGKGVLPTRGMTVALKEVGQALTWDCKVLTPGTYQVAVVCNIAEKETWKADGRMRVTIAGKTVENKLDGKIRWENPRMAADVMSAVSVLGTVKISTAGNYTLTMEVVSNFKEFTPNIRSVQLLPVDKK